MRKREREREREEGDNHGDRKIDKVREVCCYYPIPFPIPRKVWLVVSGVNRECLRQSQTTFFAVVSNIFGNILGI